MGGLTTICGVLAIAGCTAEPRPPQPQPAATTPHAEFVATRSVLRALSDWALAGYERRLLRDLPDRAATTDPAPLEERVALAYGQLREALREAGADPARLDGDLLPLVHEGIARGGRYRFVFPDDRESFAIVRVTDVRQRTITLDAQPFRYTLVAEDETLVPDYPTFVARTLAPEAQLPRPTLYESDGQGSGTVYVDRAVIEQIGERQFLPAVDALRDAARRAQEDAAFITLAGEEHLPELLGLTRGALRWRSLDSLWSLAQALPRDEQLARFVDDYAARAELRAAAELREYVRLRPPGKVEPLGPDERVLLLERASLSAMIHGEPLGAAADVLALAQASLARTPPSGEPTFVAARRLVVGLVRRLRPRIDPAEPEARVDALGFAGLARISPDALRAHARALYEERPVPAASPTTPPAPGG
jgi:hypothetical protein